MTAEQKSRLVPQSGQHIDKQESIVGGAGMGKFSYVGREGYEVTAIYDGGRTKIISPICRDRAEWEARWAEFIAEYSQAYYDLFNSLTPMSKFEIFEEDGCEALIDGEFVQVDREFYIRALGLEGQVV